MARHIVSCHVSKQARRPRSNASTSVATGGRRSLAGAVSQEKFLQGNRQTPKPTCTTLKPQHSTRRSRAGPLRATPYHTEKFRAYYC